MELWKSDGTTAGTVLVKDINPGLTAGYPNVPASSEPYGLTALDGQLLFTANDGIHGDELWKSDGTAAGTVLVKDIAPKRRDLPEQLSVQSDRHVDTACSSGPTTTLTATSCGSPTAPGRARSWSRTSTDAKACRLTRQLAVLPDRGGGTAVLLRQRRGPRR